MEEEESVMDIFNRIWKEIQRSQLILNELKRKSKMNP